MTARRAGVLALVLVVVLAAAVWLARRPAVTPAPPAAAGGPPSGGMLVATLRSEPATFNRYTGAAFPTHLVGIITQAPLVRINRLTHELEPWLAERWDRSDDGLRYVLRLREGVRFSDGHPFTADDVAFSFAAIYDAKTNGPLGDALRVGGAPLAVTARGTHDVEIAFPAPYGPGLRILDNLPIYPKHRLEAARAAGTLASAWGPTTPPEEMAGLGPFVLTQYEPGQRLVFARNPHYWRRDADGHQLPYLDGITLELVPDQNAELLRLQAGHVDLMQNELRPEDYLPLSREAEAGRVRLVDVGTSLDTHLLWFNLARAPAADPRSRWLQRVEFRRAVSHAVDREAFARTVFLGAAEPSWGPVSPANTAWYTETAERPAHDPARARELLAALGLTDADGDGQLEAPGGAPVRFTLLIQKGVTGSEKGAAFLREALAQLGVTADVVALDLGAMIGRWSSGDYDAIYHWMIATDTDPAGNMDLWLSAGSMHVWNPAQPRPATDWEAQIDRLMRRQAASLDPAERRQLFAEVQRIVAEHLPAMSFATPHVYIGTSARVASATPARQRPQVLWNADVLAVTSQTAAR